ncbi:transmembrane protein 6/97 [Myxozyma melibiosi]|uniref:Efficient mitochondria targeting-associated protein 19 n=1 Tax=Myxozyma melibiosi TaxID=54550 RepID=A0ABR1FAS1_9ASCO
MAALLSRRPLDFVYLVYFSLHLVLSTLNIGLLFPPVLRLSVQQFYLIKHVMYTNDPLFRFRPAWFLSSVLTEAALQIPFFVIAILAFHRNSKFIYIPTLIYAVNACSTTFACMADIAFGYDDTLPQADRKHLLFVYFHALLVPALMTLDMARRMRRWIPHSSASFEAENGSRRKYN